MHGTQNFQITRIFAIENDNLKIAFENKFIQTQRRIETEPHLFKKQTWKSANRSDWREWLIESQFESYTQQFFSNINTNFGIKIIPVFHAVKNEQIAWNICETGFANLSLLDSGFYGRGIYFTSNLEYAQLYANDNMNKNSTKKNKLNDEFIVILSFILIGNVYPVIENPYENDSFKGKPCQSGYDSHFTLVKPDKFTPCCFEDKKANKNFTEFVIFQENQCLIKYLLFIKKN